MITTPPGQNALGGVCYGFTKVAWQIGGLGTCMSHWVNSANFLRFIRGIRKFV
jgi:hypothetical protein